MKYYWFFDYIPPGPLQVSYRFNLTGEIPQELPEPLPPYCEYVVVYDTDTKKFSVPKCITDVCFGADPWDVEYRLPEILAQQFGIAIDEHHTWYDPGDEVLFFLIQ